MFAESLLESGTVHQKGRGWATFTSITIQSLLVAALVALPVFRPDALPTAARSFTSPVAFGRPDLPRREPSTPANASASSPERALVFVPAERAHNQPVNPTNTNEAAPPGQYIPGPQVAGSPDGVPGLRGLIPTNPLVVAVKPTRVSISILDPGSLISRVQPVYPPMAVRTRTEGTVVLRAVINREGLITQVQVLSGHPLLQQAAKAAVERWRYRPYILNGQRVEVETQIIVNFKFSR